MRGAKILRSPGPLRRVWDTGQTALFPPSFRELVPEKHLLHFVRRVVSAQFLPMLEQIEANAGARPQQVSADAGYCSEANIAAIEAKQVNGYVATGRQKHGTASATSGEEKKKGPHATAIREKLRAGGWAGPHRLRKQMIEPVFGQIKEAHGFRRFLHRGLKKVRADWRLVWSAHNGLKLVVRQGISSEEIAAAAAA